MGERSRLGTRTGDIWTAEDALPLSRDAIRWRVRSEEWQKPFPGVYARAGHLLSAEQWAIAAVMASGSSRDLKAETVGPSVAVAGGRTAARHWGLPLIDDRDPTTRAQEHLLHDVITHRTRSPRRPPRPGARVLQRHAFDLGPHDVTRLPSGLWITTPLRTAIDCLLLLNGDAAVCLLDQALRRKLFTVAELDAAVDARAGSRGVVRVRHLAALADGRSESAAETLARLLLKPWLPDLEPQVKIYDREGEIVARSDLADRKVKLSVEVDGRDGHEGRQMVAKDRAKDRRTEEQGWTTERATWSDVRRDTQPFVLRVRSTHARLTARAA